MQHKKIILEHLLSEKYFLFFTSNKTLKLQRYIFTSKKTIDKTLGFTITFTKDKIKIGHIIEYFIKGDDCFGGTQGAILHKLEFDLTVPTATIIQAINEMQLLDLKPKYFFNTNKEYRNFSKAENLDCDNDTAIIPLAGYCCKNSSLDFITESSLFGEFLGCNDNRNVRALIKYLDKYKNKRGIEYQCF